jgi:hypothetical protein
MLKCGYDGQRTYNYERNFFHGPTSKTTIQKSTGKDPPIPTMYIWTEHVNSASHPGAKRSSGLTGRPTDVSLGNLFLGNQLASLSFRDFGKNIVNGFIGFGDFPSSALTSLRSALLDLRASERVP